MIRVITDADKGAREPDIVSDKRLLMLRIIRIPYGSVEPAAAHITPIAFWG